MGVLFRRANGTFVIEHPGTGYPYHVIQGDPLYEQFLAETQTAPLEEPPPPPTPAPLAPISDRQFFQQLAVLGLIEQSDALAAVKTGTLPAVLQAVLDTMSSSDRFAAEMLLSGATSFVRDHPLVGQMGGALGWSSGQIDAFWLAAGQL